MKLIGVLIIAPIWGILSIQLFLQSLLNATSVIFNVIGLIRGKVKRSDTLLGLGVAIAHVILFSGLLYLGNYLLSEFLPFGYTKAENIVYWVFVLIGFFIILPQFPLKIKKKWRFANVPGSLQVDIARDQLKRFREEREGQNQT